MTAVLLDDNPLVGRQWPTMELVPDSDYNIGAEIVGFAGNAGLVLDPWQERAIRDGASGDYSAHGRAQGGIRRHHRAP